MAVVGKVLVEKTFHPDEMSITRKNHILLVSEYCYMKDSCLLLDLAHAALSRRPRKLQKSHSRIPIALNCLTRAGDSLALESLSELPKPLMLRQLLVTFVIIYSTKYYKQNRMDGLNLIFSRWDPLHLINDCR